MGLACGSVIDMYHASFDGGGKARHHISPRREQRRGQPIAGCVCNRYRLIHISDPDDRQYWPKDLFLSQRRFWGDLIENRGPVIVTLLRRLVHQRSATSDG